MNFDFDFNEFEKRDDLRHPDPLSDTTSMNKHEYTRIYSYRISNREPDKYHQSKNLTRYILVQKYQKCKI